MTEPFYILNSNVSEFQFLHLFACYFPLFNTAVFLVDVKWYLIIVLENFYLDVINIFASWFEFSKFSITRISRRYFFYALYFSST